MTKEELEKATGQELIEVRDYCGVDGYYGEYLKDVNKEMLKRFNQLTELEKENVKAKEIIKSLFEDIFHFIEKNPKERGCKKHIDDMKKARDFIKFTGANK